MRIILKPDVQIVSAPVHFPHPVYRLPRHEKSAEQIIAMAGKVCYDSYGLDGNPVANHVRNLVGSGHHSVLEHVHIGLFIEGISRGCSHEIVRHRMFNYSQRSTRYTDEGDAAIVLDPYFAPIYEDMNEAAPEGWAADEATSARYDIVGQFITQCHAAFAAYGACVARLEKLNPAALHGKELRKWCRGKARQLLPHALETRMVMTGNLRSWRHFLLMRSSRHAEAEIRRLAECIWHVLRPMAPTVFEDLDAETFDGFVELAERGERA